MKESILFISVTISIALVICIVLLIKKKTFTSPFIQEQALENNSIAEEIYLPLGGDDQWVLLRGKNIDNPILVFLHGGPGISAHGLFRHYNSELENHYLVVGWDQRGAGKSYSKKIDPKSLKIEQYISDLHELIQYLKNRFGKEKIYLMGESWGSILGTLYASKYPQDLIAYIGIGQVANIQKSEVLGYQFTLKEAKKRKHNKALKELQNIIIPGQTPKDIKIQRKWLIKFNGFLQKYTSLYHYIPKILSADEYAWPDLIWVLLGNKQSLESLWPQIFEINFFEQVPSLDIPVFFFLGKYDNCVSSTLAAEYFQQLKAPYKKLIWFENSGHHPHFEESESFNNFILSLKVRK